MLLLHKLKFHIRTVVASVCLLVIVIFALLVVLLDNNDKLSSVIAMDDNSAQAMSIDTPRHKDGDLLRAYNTQDIYIIKITNTGKRYKRLILNPAIFESYGHLKWGNVKNVPQSTLNYYITSALIQEWGKPQSPIYRVFPDGDVGTKRQIVMKHDEFIATGYSYDAIYKVNWLEIGNRFYKTGTPIYYKQPQAPNPKPQAPNPIVEVEPVVTQPPATTTTSIRTNTNTSNMVQSVVASARYGCDTRLLGIDNAVRDRFLVHQHLCIRLINSSNSSYAPRKDTAYGYYLLHPRNKIEVYLDKGRTYEQIRYTLLHELCHAQQDYYYYRHHNSTGSARHTTRSWLSTSAGQSFVRIVGYTRNIEYNTWILPFSSPYKRYYNKAPYELAAEMCVITVSPEAARARYSQAQIQRVLNDREVQQWLSTYMLQPKPSSTHRTI